RVVTVLYEKNIPFELVSMAVLKGEHKSPQNMQQQPCNQIPYIVRCPCDHPVCVRLQTT
ncbi:hypothetical protein L208DRAFT_1344447, partial [Tricholoma matsutake]